MPTVPAPTRTRIQLPADRQGVTDDGNRRQRVVHRDAAAWSRDHPDRVPQRQRGHTVRKIVPASRRTRTSRCKRGITGHTSVLELDQEAVDGKVPRA